MRLGILMPNWVGDAVMATPMLRTIRSHFQHEFICGIMRPCIADTLAGEPWFDELIYYDRRADRRTMGTSSVVQQLKRVRVDAMLLLTNSLRSAWIGWASGASRRIGYARYGRSLLLTDRLLPKRDGRKLLPTSPVDYYLDLARVLGCAAGNHSLSLATRPQDEQAADDAWRACGFEPNDPVVALNTGGAYGPAKDWPAEHFAALARKIAEHLRAHVLVVCGPAERQTAQTVERLAGHPWVRSLADRPLSIGLSKACLRRSTLVVSTDSGPRHLAAGFGVPVVALFGPTDPRWSENYHELETRLSLDLACRPCAQRECPLTHHRCMRDLSVNQVFSAVVQVWNARRSRAA